MAALYHAEHFTCSDSDPYSLFLCRTGIRVRVRTRVRLRQCKSAIRTFTSIIPVAGQKLCLHPNLHRTASSLISSLPSLEQGHLKVVEGQVWSRWGHTQGHSNGTEHAQPIGASVAVRSVALATKGCPILIKSENVN